jgi:hypothetical protein
VLLPNEDVVAMDALAFCGVARIYIDYFFTRTCVVVVGVAWSVFGFQKIDQLLHAKSIAHF